jgi:hypothetical protein
MKNEYIEVVKRWLAGEVVSVEALQANADAAWAAYNAEAAYVATEAEAAAEAAYVAAARAAAAAYWVKRYEELTNEK